MIFVACVGEPPLTKVKAAVARQCESRAMSGNRHVGWKRALVGVVLTVTGSVALSWMIWAISASDAWSARLGLAPATVFSAAAQIMVFVGVWMLWSAFRAGR